MSFAKYTYRCDGCGVTIEQGARKAPPGWHEVVGWPIGPTALINLTGHYCSPECLAQRLRAAAAALVADQVVVG
jgi:hypothetical protein